MKKIFITAVLTLLAAGYSFAQSDSSYLRAHEFVRKSYNIYFDINDSDVSLFYQNNIHTLEHLKEFAYSTLNYAGELPDTVFITATASPDGPVTLNQSLARERAYSVKESLLNIVPEFAGSEFVIRYHIEDWDGMRQALLSDEAFPQRDQMLRVLDEGAEGLDYHNTLKEFIQGWEYFVNNHIHTLRNASISFVGYTDKLDDEFTREVFTPAGETSVQQELESENVVSVEKLVPTEHMVAEPPQTFVADQAKKMIMAFNTNLLTPAMSVGVEFPIGNHFSIGLDYYYPWLLPKSNKWCLETLALFAEARYWFPGKSYKWSNDQRLQGHAVGVYGGAGYYDYQLMEDGIQGEFVDFGVDYTFALPVAKGKLRMEFNIGVGMIRSWYRPYYMSSDYVDLIKEPGILYNSTNFIGPTRAGISLVVPIRVQTKVK